MDGLSQTWKDWPLAGWVLVAACLAFVGRFVVLYGQYRRHRLVGTVAEQRLAQMGQSLAAYAAGHLQRLPESLDEIAGEQSAGIAYRPVPRLTLDARLMLLHDDRPVHKVLQFPNLRDGRGVLFCSGRLLVVSEEAFDKLQQADSALRQKLGLDC